MNPLEKPNGESSQSKAKSAHPGPRRPATPLYEISGRPDLGLAPERPSEAIRWLGAGFGLAFLVLLALGLIWIVVSGVGTGRWVWEPAPAVSSTPRSATPTPLSEAVPTLSPEASPSPSATPAGTAGRGTIRGSVGFPSEFAPSQIICAELTTSASTKYCTDYAGGTGTSLGYSLTVPAGTYYVYARLKSAEGAYPQTYRAYYNEYVTCGMEASCAAELHDNYIPVTVKVGSTVTGINPTDWYKQQ